MTNRVRVTATRWHLGWELELDGGGVTQARTLDKAEQQVRDYLDTVDPETAHDGWVIEVVPDVGPLYEEARQAKALADAAAAATVEASRRMRRAARELRQAGLSVTDAAVVLGVSRGRVSQLTRDTPGAGRAAT